MSWPENLELAKKDSKTFLDKGEKIVKRFRDERNNSQTSSAEKRYNILWSNVRTLFPAVYSRKPKAQVERRYKDADPVGRTAAQILERALQYEIDHYPDYDASLRGSVMDRLLPGRGVTWVRFEAGDQITDDVTEGDKDEEEGVGGAPAESVEPAMDPMAGVSLLGALIPEQPQKTDPADYECTPCDYVFWKDFRHSPSRTWEEVTWVARRVYMAREEGIKRFGDKFKDVPLKHEPVGLDKDVTVTDSMKKAVVWEIWDKPSKSVIWRAEDFADDLDKKDDPLNLECFFPCPKPLFATTTTDTLQPIADYLEYQDQAMEIDELTQRISMLTRAVKAVGVYDASQPAVARLMEEGSDNTLIPVETWAAFAQAGGLKGTVELLPMDMIIQTLNELYKARDVCKQTIYEITGMSDILRGASDPNETYGAQKIKSQFGSMRLREIQQDVARFATDLLCMKAQIMSRLYRPETLKEMSGIMMTEDAQHADQAVQLLQNESMRSYRIEVAADSMVELDEEGEKQSRVEFLTAAGGFLQQAVQAVQVVPEMAPLMGEMLMFGVRAYKAGRPLEAAFEQFVQKVSQPQQPKPDPEQTKLQGHMQIEQMKTNAQAERDRADLEQRAQIAAMEAKFKADSDEAQRNHEAQLEQLRMQMQAEVDTNRQRSEAEQQSLKINQEAELEQLKAQYEDQRHQREMDFEKWKFERQQEQERWKAELDASVRIETANMAAAVKTNDPATQTATREIASEVTQQPDFTPLTAAVEKFAAAAQQMSKPRKRTLVRGEDGRATGMIEE